MMKKEIKEHYGSEDILKIKLHVDIENWRAEIKFIEEEISFYTDMLQLPFFEKMNATAEKSLFEKELATFKTTNEAYSQKVTDAHNTLEGLNECEDIQCETYFLSGHEEFRNEVEKHIEAFRNLKTRIFAYTLAQNVE